MPLPAAVVGDAYLDGVAWDVLEELVAIGDRHPGHRGERRGAEVVERRLTDVGLSEVETTEFEIPGWWRESSVLSIETGPRTFDQQHELLAHPGTASCDVTAPLVDVGWGTPEAFAESDVDGAIALASSSVPEGYGREVSRMEKYVTAADEGAVGFVFRTHVPGALPPTGSNAADRIPSVGVSREVGAHLERRCSAGRPEAHLTVRSRVGDATSQNVTGTLGPDSDEEVLVTAHVDSHDISDGARDNGVGTALVVETARLLARVESDLETRVRFAAFGAEEIGLSGARHWLETREVGRVKCAVNVDAAGPSRTLELRSQGFDEVAAAFEDVAADLGVPLDVDDSVGPGTDAWAFARRGVPAVTAASTSGGTEAVEVEPGRAWGHTHADTIDKLDRRDLRDLAVQIAATVLELTRRRRDLARKNPETVREALADHHERVLRGTGRWPDE